jgi:hypothetical protein
MGVGKGCKILNFQIFLEKKGTDRLGAEKGKNLKLEKFFLPLFCVIFGKKSQGKWIKKKISVNPQKRAFSNGISD